METDLFPWRSEALETKMGCARKNAWWRFATCGKTRVNVLNNSIENMHCPTLISLLF